MPERNILYKRLIISLVIGLILGAVISEVPFLFLRETARPPQDVILEIPKGAAESVARGEQPPSIPDDMIFVVGDILIVRNNDVVDHQLGPLWIPAGTSARLALLNEENLAFECSFSPNNYFGLDIHQSLTWQTRLSGITFAGLPMGILIALYSFIFPAKKTQNAAA